MNINDFSASTAGRAVRTAEGYTAFLPNPLPPAFSLGASGLQLLSEADRALGELSGIGRVLPNPHLLIRPSLSLEAIFSSRIEGTKSGMEDLFNFEAEPTQSTGNSDVIEVVNYVRALDYGLARLQTLPLSTRLVCEIHGILMKGVRGSYAAPGEFRHTPNWIGPPGSTLSNAPFVPPPPHEMAQAMSDWEKYLNSHPAHPVLLQSAFMHYQFEAIHPFVDGNGRVGRLLIPLLLYERKALSQPLLYLSEYFERHRDEYYGLLMAVSRHGRWQEWVEYFLHGVRIQARAAIDTTRMLLDQHQSYKNLLGVRRVPAIAHRLVDHLFSNPVISVTHLARAWNTPYPTVNNGVQFLVRRGILRELTGQRRNRLYAAHAIFSILEKPASGNTVSPPAI